MSFKHLNGLSGFDMSVPEYELRAQMEEKEKQICTFFTDDFLLNIRTPLGPDAKIYINVLKQKVVVSETAQYLGFVYSKATFTRTQWRWVVIDFLLSSINQTYGDVPYKEAAYCIDKIMYKKTEKAEQEISETHYNIEQTTMLSPEQTFILATTSSFNNTTGISTKRTINNDHKSVEAKTSFTTKILNKVKSKFMGKDTK